MRRKMNKKQEQYFGNHRKALNIGGMSDDEGRKKKEAEKTSGLDHDRGSCCDHALFRISFNRWAAVSEYE